jgi:hypothetical protein
MQITFPTVGRRKAIASTVLLWQYHNKMHSKGSKVMNSERQDHVESDIRQDVDRTLATNPNDDPANRDPISGQSGSHPVGTGIGAAAVGAAATAIGAVGGPVGAVVGAVVGSVVGGLVGKNAAERVNPTQEEEYWRTNYVSRPYIQNERTYDDYQSAYRSGYEGFRQYAAQGKTYEEVEPNLQREYELSSQSALTWEEARYASRDAWDRLDWSARFREEDEYWRDQYNFQTYYQSGLTYEDYEPAYRTGYEGFGHFHREDKNYEEVEPQLQRQFGLNAATSRLNWEQAKDAVRDGWYHMENRFRNR